MPDNPSDQNSKFSGLDELGDLLTSIDSQVRESAVRAHSAVLEEIAKIKSLQIDDIKIQCKALLPHEILETSRISMEFDVDLRDNGVSLFRRYKLSCGGTRAT